MDLRHAFDITPFDTSGHSAFGLTRGQAKVLGLGFILVGLALADPPFSLLPTDFLNLALAGLLVKWFSIGLGMAVLLTYTVIAWSVFLLGIYIYPYNTSSLFNGYVNKFQALIKRSLKNPIYVILGLVVFYYMFNVYKGWLL